MRAGTRPRGGSRVKRSRRTRRVQTCGSRQAAARVAAAGQMPYMTDRHGLQAKLQSRIVPFAAGSRKAGPRQGIAAPGQHPHHPRIAAAQPGRQTGARAGHPGPGVVAAEGRADRGDPVRGGARAPAGLHRRPAGGRSRGDAQRGRQGQKASQADRAPGAGRSGGRSLGPGGLRASAQCAPAQHAHRVHAQSGPIRVPQVGDERLRRAEDRPSRHRDRAPGQPRVPGSRRTRARRRLLSRFTCRNRLPHHDDQRARHRGLGRGGIEAEAAMLGQPTYFLTPDVVGVHLLGSIRSGVTGTDVVLTVTAMLRKAKVVGKFVEFFGEGASNLVVPERATIANMAPEYGATMGYFPVDELTCQYLLATGRPKAKVDAVRAYFQAQQMFGIPKKGQCDYTQVLELDLASVKPSVAGPKRPQDRIELPKLKEVFGKILQEPAPAGYGKAKEEVGKRYHQIVEPLQPVPHVTGGGEQAPETVPEAVRSGLTSKNTNPLTEAEMMTAGIVAKKAVEKGLQVRPEVKTSLAPGSRVVSRYLEKTGLQPYLDKLGFTTVGYGCTTCIGNSGPLEPHVEQLVNKHDLIAASVLSGNRNFEARVHQSIKANFLMSPPLVVAFAIAG